MSIIYYFIFLFILNLFQVQGQSTDCPCQYFYKRLKFIPNEELTLTKGTFNSLLYGEDHEGCEVKFVTNDSLLTNVPKPDPIPSFLPRETASLYENGWRRNINYDAEGPGTRLFVIQKEDTLCLVSYSQPATLLDNGKTSTAKDITVTIQCRNINN